MINILFFLLNDKYRKYSFSIYDNLIYVAKIEILDICLSNKRDCSNFTKKELFYY